ncbi:redoxin domain-containing protein [Tellurirhabdus rosea]|uniref:redoxin domain-containing protein n=1 Tax=Tellurirhabdus rosea TaxID=2674997 RepID=UPI00224EF4DD|nr:TlpA disulfide reductase family protein [Tellurirhabdus rosea]
MKSHPAFASATAPYLLAGLFVWFSLLPASGFAQAAPGGPFSLVGTLPQAMKGKVYLIDQQDKVFVSAPISGNTFLLKGNLREPGLYKIRLNAEPNMYFIFVSPAVTKVKINQDKTLQVEGPALHRQWAAYNSGIEKFKDTLIDLSMKRRVALQQGDSLRFRELMRRNDSVSVAVYRFIEGSMVRKPYTFLNLFLLEQGRSDEFIAGMLDELRPQFSAYPTFQQLDSSLKEKAARLERFGVGKEAYNFTLHDSASAVYSLESIRKSKKLVLLDFWASWCGPCISEIPALQKLQAQYADRGLQIVGISTDVNPRLWKTALNRHKPAGMQLIVDRDNPAVIKNYAIYSIPQTFLIGPDGKILALDLRGEALAKKVAELLEH